MITIRKFTKADCRPCAMLTHYMDANADTIAETGATIETVDIADQPDANGVPTVIYERNGHEMARSVGVTAAEEYAKEAK